MSDAEKKLMVYTSYECTDGLRFVDKSSAIDYQEKLDKGEAWVELHVSGFNRYWSLEDWLKFVKGQINAYGHNSLLGVLESSHDSDVNSLYIFPKPKEQK